MSHSNFRLRVFDRTVLRTFGPGGWIGADRVRHTFANLHLARGTNLEWVKELGG
jgi:hypothetical protein